MQDYRKLNEMTIKNLYPLPLIQELIDKLKQSHYFSKMDVRWGYNNICIVEGGKWKAACRTNRGACTSQPSCSLGLPTFQPPSKHS